jgi:hypothetical protein
MPVQAEQGSNLGAVAVAEVRFLKSYRLLAILDQAAKAAMALLLSSLTLKK